LKSASDPNFRQAILRSLQNANYRSKAGVTPLVGCLKDGNVAVRLMACNLLGNIGANATAALPALRDLANDTNQAVQQASRAAVQRIETKN
jgi:HEAT repeat protein